MVTNLFSVSLPMHVSSTVRFKVIIINVLLYIMLQCHGDTILEVNDGTTI
jgi:hypothetical protein